MPAAPSEFPDAVDLARFVEAQADPRTGFEAALGELAAGRKLGHWIWYIFPQLRGLGWSPMAVRYGLAGIVEADAYLGDALLCARLCQITGLVANWLRCDPPGRLDQLMGAPIDAQKVVSSMTLFRAAALQLGVTAATDAHKKLAGDAKTILTVAAAQGLPPCAATLRLIAGRCVHQEDRVS